MRLSARLRCCYASGSTLTPKRRHRSAASAMAAIQIGEMMLGSSRNNADSAHRIAKTEDALTQLSTNTRNS
eukprot:904898-Rhodomonas_salina.2